MDINAKRGPVRAWVAKDNVREGIQRLFREFLQTFSLQGEHIYQGRLREMCTSQPRFAAHLLTSNPCLEGPRAQTCMAMP